MKYVSILIFFFSVAALNVSGQNILKTDNPRQSRLDSLVHENVLRYFGDTKAVGLSLGLILRGKSYFYNYGETKAGNGKLPNKQTIYEIGSTTKSFTGILLAKAVLDKKIVLSDDIRKYLKGSFPNLEYNGTPITIQALSNHTSRITRIFPNLWERAGYDPLNPWAGYSRALLYEGLHKMKLNTVPGKIYSYSNMAVGLLGTILEDIYGKNYFSLIFKEVLEPLSMSDTRIDISTFEAERIAWPHNEKREPVPLWDISLLPAIGALRSTAADMTKYIIANNIESDPAIRLSHQRTFGTDKEGMALNWFIHSSKDGYKIFEHGGGTGGSRSSFECFPQLNAGFVILTNSLANRNQLERDIAAIIIREATATSNQ